MPVDSCDVAWAAGLFEGEGSCCMLQGKWPRLQLTMTDEDVVRRFAHIMGGTVYGPYVRGSNRKTTWNCTLSGAEKTQAALRLMWPYLGERRKARAADVIAQYYEVPMIRGKGQFQVWENFRKFQDARAS